MKIKIQNLIIALALLAGIHQAAAQGTTAFTYQGQLHDGGTNANGTYTMTFKLYDSSGGNNQIGSDITTSSTLANGLFTVNLDFGAGAFNGSARWLDIAVQSGSDSEELTPRVQVLPTPYAQFASVAATVTNGAIMNAQIAANAIATTNIQNGAITTAQIANGAVTNANLTANAVATTNIQNNAVTTAQIAANAVATANIQDNAVTTTKISDGNVTNPKLAANSVTTGNIEDSTVTAAKIASGQVVKSLNGLTDAVTLSGGQNVTLTPSGNNIEISATLTNSTAFGNWTINGSSGNLIFYNSGTERFGIAANTPAGIGVFGELGMQDGGDIEMNNGPIYDVSELEAQTVNAVTVNQSSDKNLKEKFTSIDSQKILERVASLPISSWNYKQDAETRHIGPMAQDFYAAFNVGTDDKHIATVDEGGVALAAIQGLNEKLKTEDAQKDAQIKALEKRLSDLEQLIKTPAQK